MDSVTPTVSSGNVTGLPEVFIPPTARIDSEESHDEPCDTAARAPVIERSSARDTNVGSPGAGNGRAEDGSGGAGAGGAPGAAPNEAADSDSFTIRLRGIRQSEKDAFAFTADTPQAALEAALAYDVAGIDEAILTWKDRKRLVAIDIDRPPGGCPVDVNELADFFPEALPRPLCAWASHDAGLRAMFVGTDEMTAMEAAGVWCLCAPLRHLVGWHTEVKTDSRHPKSLRDGVTCGPVMRFTPTSNVVVPGSRERSAASDEEIESWLDERGLSFGRHETEHCPWCGGVAATCNDSVLIDERGVRCHRCQKSASWDHLVGRLIDVDKPSLYEAARAFVHYPHQEFILGALRPNVPRELLQPAWRTMLHEVHCSTLEALDADARDALRVIIERAASSQVDIVRSSRGAWLDRGTLQPRKISADRTLKMLPWARSPIMVDAAQNGGPLAGFATVHPVDVAAVIGPFVEPPRGAVFARPGARAGDLPPVDLGDGPPLPEAVDRAWAQVDLRLPQLDRAYVETLLCAQFCAQRATSTPPIIIVTGPPGGGKTAVQHLVAAMVGTRAGMFELGDAKATLRAFGLLLSSRHNVTFVDEVGRIWDLYWKIEPLLRANSSIVFEAKYANEETIGVTAPISLLGSTLPAAITRSSELGRRSVGIRVRGATKQWKLEGGLDLASIRALADLRPHLDVITASVWWAVHELGPGGNWRDLCLTRFGALPLQALDLLDADAAGRDEIVRALYDKYRTAKEEDLSKGMRWKGWLIADPNTPTGDLLGELVDFGDTRRHDSDIADIERLNLEAVLGFADPALVIKIHRRSATWLVKFLEVGVAKGRGTPRTKLPPPVIKSAAGPAAERETVEL